MYSSRSVSSHRQRPRRPSTRSPRTAESPHEDSSTTEQSHAEHFLCRVLRCEGTDLDRAMRLYHHSDLVRRLVPELMENLLPGYERAAIPLRPHPPCPHVVVTSTGSFVTCLAEEMGLRDLPVLPYGPLDHEIGQVELATGRKNRLESIFAALPPNKLVRGLAQGPGAVTREMVAILEKDPWAYEVLVYKLYTSTSETISYWAKLKAKVGYDGKLQAEYYKLEMTLKQCARLIGALDGPMTEEMEPLLMQTYSPALWDFVAAVARKPGRGRVLLRGMQPVGMYPEWVRAAAFDGLLMHCQWYPEEARWIVPKLRELPPPGSQMGWYEGWATAERAALTPEQCVAWFRETQEQFKDLRGRHELIRSECPFWDFSLKEIVFMTVLQSPVSHWFPPAALADRITQAFAEHLRNPPKKDPELTPVKPIVRSGPRVERNAPCPCGSGLKYKRCCAAATHTPPPG